MRHEDKWKPPRLDFIYLVHFIKPNLLLDFRMELGNKPN